MIKNFPGRVRIVMLFVLCMTVLLSTAVAQEESMSLQLGTQLTAEGTLPKVPENYVVRISADAAHNPMPNGQTGGSYDLVVSGNKKAVFPTVEFEKLGIYTYTVKQVAGSYPDCKYDARTYTLSVSVVNAQAGGYDMIVALRENGKDEKLDTMVFHNVYKTIVTPPGQLTPTGVEDLRLWYIGASAMLLIMAVGMACVLLRQEVGKSER